MENRREELQIEFLYEALTEAQGIVNFTDTKAGAVIVLVGGFLALIGADHTEMNPQMIKTFTSIGKANLLVAMVCSIWAAPSGP